MYRTTIMLPEELKSRVVRESQALGISLGEFVRGALSAAVDASESKTTSDPLLADHACHTGRVPRDAAAKHDDYLYEAGA